MKVNRDKLESGRELDALVAQHVMGWKSVHRLDIGKGGKRDQYRGKKPDKLGRWRSADVRHYSTNPADAYLIAPRMKELGLWERYVKELSKTTRHPDTLRSKSCPHVLLVEDNLAALRILEQEAQTPDEAVKAAQQTVAVVSNQYKAGITSYLDVIIAQTSALNNERTSINILGNRLNASVLLIRALGGGWNAAQLP
jgi:Outer membrane efflux protein